MKSSYENQMVKFFGIGDGLSGNHTNGYFETANELVFVDMSMAHFARHKAMIAEAVENGKQVKVILTHMHDDHVSGLYLTIQFAYYIKHVKLTVLAPYALIEDIKTDAAIKGVSTDIFNLKVATNGCEEWLCSVVPVTHSPELAGKCFGYVFFLNGAVVTYSGDTNDITPLLPFASGSKELYLDCSADYGVVHILYKDVKATLEELTEKGCHVYLMHMDNPEKICHLIAGKDGISVPYVDVL